MTWLDRFLAACRRRGLSGKTLDLYEGILSNLDLDLSKCSLNDVNGVLDKVSKRSNSYYRLNVILVKAALDFLGRKKISEKIQLPKVKDRADRIREKLLDPGEVKKLIEKAPTDQDRLGFSLLYELGCRIGELYNVRMKDVQFDKYGAIIWLTGKSGTRSRRVYSSVPDLKTHINSHPEKDKPEAKLFRYGRKGSSKAHERTMANRYRRIGKDILGRNIHPHMFRHTKATEDSKLFTDREMMILFGWKRPDMVSTYSHLSLRDVEEKDLVLHGMKSKEEILKPLVQVRKCVKCGVDNAPVSMFCHKCGASLSLLTFSPEELKEHIMKYVREAK